MSEKVKTGDEILHKGIWYRAGDVLPDDYVKPNSEPKPKAKTKQKDEVK